MKKNIIRILILIVVLTTFNSFDQPFTLAKEGSEVKIKGTSNLHDWEMNLVASDLNAKFNTDKSGLISISSVDFTCKVSDIRSNNSIMDRKTYAALKADDFKVIKLNISSGNELSSHEGKFKGKLRGNLFISGITKEVDIPFSGTLNADNTISVEGSLELKMSDFNISPPTAILGTLKTGDEISVDFSFKLLSKI